jgi:hypothetical protein
MATLDDIITQELIDKINAFFEKYGIDKDCSDIREKIVIITEADCVGEYADMVRYAGKYDPKTRELILVQEKIIQRVFVHEYMHKKSAKHRLLRKDLLGVKYNKHFSHLDEAITEKITCEILNIPDDEQLWHPYASVFIGIDELCNLISWENIVLSYFNNDKKIYYKALEKDTNIYLDLLSQLYYYNPPSITHGGCHILFVQGKWVLVEINNGNRNKNIKTFPSSPALFFVLLYNIYRVIISHLG